MYIVRVDGYSCYTGKTLKDAVTNALDHGEQLEDMEAAQLVSDFQPVKIEI